MVRSTLLLVVAATLSALATAAIGQTSDPQVPNPAHPFPDNPIATDGSSLRSIWPTGGSGPRQGAGRYVLEPVLQAYSPTYRGRRAVAVGMADRTMSRRMAHHQALRDGSGHRQVPRAPATAVAQDRPAPAR